MRIYDATGDGGPDDGTSAASFSTETRSVGVADYAVTVDGTTLITSGLGSCVAVGLYDDADATGLLHVMLPSADGRPVDNPAKFADTGVQTLLTSLHDVGVPTERMKAKLAGGSEMIAFESQARSVGDRNVEAVRAALAEHDVPLLAEDVGGDQGRSVKFTLSGDLHIRTARDGVRIL